METIDNTSLIISPERNDGTIIPSDDQGGHGEDPAIEEMDSKVLQAPCVVCYVPVVGVADKTRIFDPLTLTPEEKNVDKIFQWFLMNFRYSFKKKKLKGGAAVAVRNKHVERFDDLFKCSSRGWDGEGGRSPPLPFCEECKNEVVGLMEKMNDFEDLEKRIGREEEEELKEGIREMRRKMGRCEEEFLESGIYEKDKRYQRVRRYIVNIGRIAGGYKTKETVEEVPEEKERPEVGAEVEVPCIICCETVKIVLGEKEAMGARKEEDFRIFRWFITSFKNPQSQQLFGTERKYLAGEVTEAWDGKWGMSDPLQFCGGCRGEVVEGFRGMKSDLLRRRRVKWMGVTRGRMKEHEDKFVESGIYERDWRYFNVRRKVIKVVEPEVVKAVEGKKKEEEDRSTLKFVEEETGVPGIDKIMEQRFKKILPRRRAQQQVVRVVVKQEEKMEEEEEDEEWPWEDEEEPPIIQVKEEEDGEGDPLGPDTGACGMEVEDDSDKQIHYRNCLLCYKAISKKESVLAPVLTNDLNEQNFNVVFILRKMLNVPKGRLVGYLENFGCPGKWVEYCKDCLYLVDAALRIQKEISELEDKLRKCQEKMVMKIKSTSMKLNRSLENTEKITDKVTRVTEETRQLVISKAIPRKKLNEKVNQAVCVLPQEVVSNADYDNDPLEYPSALPSPPDEFDLDPSYVDNCASPCPSLEQVALKGSSAKKRKLSVQDRLCIQNRSIPGSSDSEEFLKTLKSTGYTCYQCPHIKKPMSFPKFYRHLIFHAKRPFKCSICNVHWSGPSELEKNPFVKENPSSTTEHVCSEATLAKILEENGKFNPGGNLWKCKWCPEKFEKKRDRDLHERKEHSSLKNKLGKKYKCLSCSKGYRDFKEWLLHRALDHPWIAAISCLFCDFTSVAKTKEGIDILNLGEMKAHLCSNHPTCKNFFVSPETCDFCGIPFKFGKDNLAKHIKDDHKLTSGQSTYSCPCCYTFRAGQLPILMKHLSLHHFPNPTSAPTPKYKIDKTEYNKRRRFKVICDICGKMMRGGLVLMEHKLRQHGIEPKDMSEYAGQKVYKCERGGEECGGYRTLIRRKLDEHMIKLHGMESKFKCEECGKEFANSTHLGRHKDIHRNKGVKPHQCEICGNSFAVRNYLYIHMRLSHQNRPFASTNRKRTTRKGGSKVGKVSRGVDSKEMRDQGQQPPTQGRSVVSNGEGVNYGGDSVHMDIS